MHLTVDGFPAMRVVQITALCARRWRNWISGRDLGRQHQNCLSTDLTRAAGLSCRGDRNPLLYRQAKFPMAIRWRLRPSSSIFAPFWDSAKRIRWVAGMASATLAGGSHKTDFRNRKPETWNSAVRSQFAGLGSQVSGLRPQVRSQISDFRFRSFTLQSIQANFLSVLPDGGHNVQCQS